MEIPKSFKPKENLDERTDRLLKEGPKQIQKGKNEDLEWLLGVMSQTNPYILDPIDSVVQETLEQHGYKPLKSKWLKYKYWTKQSPTHNKEIYIFIKKWDKNKINSYSFFSIETDKIKKFCRSFERSQRAKEWNLEDYAKKYFLPGGLIGLVAIEATLYALSPDLFFRLKPATYAFGGVMFFLASAILSPFGMEIKDYYLGIKRFNKMTAYCSEIIIDDNITAVKEALS